MKKIIRFIFATLVLVCLGGCVDMNKKILVETEYNIQNAIELTEQELVSKLKVDGNETGDDFVLYVYTPGCMGCESFKKIALNPYIQETSARIYSVTNTVAKKYLALSNKDSSPVIIIFKEGKQLAKTGALYDESTFASKDGLKTYLDKYIVVSKMMWIDEENLDSLIASKQEVVVYFSWNECGDCASFKEYYLNEYLLNNKANKVFYAFETNEWRSQKDEHPEVWEAFAKKYQIDSYQGGKIPSIVYYNEGVKKDMVVYLNDIFDFNESGLKVTGSYYKDAPYVNQTYKDYNAYKEGVKEFHNSKVDDFLNKYCE